MLMLILTLGLVLTAALLARAGYWNRRHSLDFGWMSHQWVASHNASQRSSSL